MDAEYVEQKTNDGRTSGSSRFRIKNPEEFIKDYEASK